MAAGVAHSAVCDSYGEVWLCGHALKGQLGLDVSPHQHISAFHPLGSQLRLGRHVCQISCGSAHTIALSDRGDLLCWGAGKHGQLGSFPCPPRISPQLVNRIPGRVAYVTCGPLHTVVVCTDRRIFAWGSGPDGCLGSGVEYSPLPRNTYALMSKTGWRAKAPYGQYGPINFHYPEVKEENRGREKVVPSIKGFSIPLLSS